MFDSIDDAINFANQKQSDGGLPFFRWESILNKKTDEYEDVAWVMIVNKGDSKSIIERAKRTADETRWPEYWKAFVDGGDVPLDGIPLKECAVLTPADISTCQRFHLRTVEDVIAYPDVQLRNLGGRGTHIKKVTTKWYESRQGTEVKDLKKRIEELEKLVVNNTGNVPKRAAGDRVSKPKHSGRKQQSRRKSNTSDSKASSESAI